MNPESQSIESVTTSLEPTSGAPDAKTRRYDRQLRLWAASGQAALESARILVIPASATATSILKNLVLPGLGHFTLLDDRKVTGADAGNNFFLDGFRSVGKSRAEEGVNGLRELNDGVQGVADTRDIKELLKSERDWLKSFDIIIAHNIHPDIVTDLAALLWPETHLVVVNSAGFLAEFSIHYREHQSTYIVTSLLYPGSFVLSNRITLGNCCILAHRPTLPCSSRVCHVTSIRYHGYNGSWTYPIPHYSHSRSRGMAP